MGTGFSCPQGTIGIGSSGTLGDQSGTFAVALGLTSTGFISNTGSSGGYFTNQDLGAILQTKFYNVFYTDSLLCDYPAGVNLATKYSVQQAGGLDINNYFALYNSIYCSLSNYNQTGYTTGSDGGGTYKISTTNLTASPTYASGATTYAPYTYQWSLVPTYTATAYPVNPNTSITLPTSASTKFKQYIGTGYTKQLAVCKITDSRGWIGYSRACVLNFI